MFINKQYNLQKIFIIIFMVHLFLNAQTIYDSKINRTAILINDTIGLTNLYQNITQHISPYDTTKGIHYFPSIPSCEKIIYEIPYNELFGLNNWKFIKAISISNLDRNVAHDFGIIIAQPLFDDNKCLTDPTSINFWMDYHKKSTTYYIYLGDIMWKNSATEQWDWYLKYANLKENDNE